MNALAAVRLMAHSDDDDDDEDANNHEDLNDGEFLKMHFESSVPDKPLKSILKRKCNTSSEIMTAESATSLTSVEKKTISTSSETTGQAQSREKGPNSMGLAQALKLIRDNPPTESGDVNSSELVLSSGESAALKPGSTEQPCPTSTEQTIASEQQSATSLSNPPPATTPVQVQGSLTVAPASGDSQREDGTTSPVAADDELTADKLQTERKNAEVDNQSTDASDNQSINVLDNQPRNAEKPVAKRKRIVVKITGLPFQYNCSDLITFLGFWPRNGTDGIRMVCDTSGDPSGVAYVEVDREKDKMDAMRLSGMLFQNRRLKVMSSSANDMEIDWSMTIRITKQIEKSPFIQLSGLPYLADKHEIQSWFKNYDRELEDIYIDSQKKGQHNDGTAFVIMDSAEQASEVCKQKFVKDAQACKVHPEQVSRWCRRARLPLIVRPCVKYDMSVDVPPIELEPEGEKIGMPLGLTKKSFSTLFSLFSDETQGGATSGDTSTKPSHSLTKSAEKSESATMGNDLVYVYDPDTHNEVASGAVSKVSSSADAKRSRSPPRKNPSGPHPSHNKMPGPHRRGSDPPGPGGPGAMFHEIGPGGPFPPRIGPPLDHPMGPVPFGLDPRMDSPRGMPPRFGGPPGMDPRFDRPLGIIPRFGGPLNMGPRFEGPPGMHPRIGGPPGMDPRFDGPPRQLPPFAAGPGMIPMRPDFPRPPPGPRNMHPLVVGPLPQPMGPRPVGPVVPPAGPGQAMLPGRMPSVYVRMYNLPEQASTDDIKDFFSPVLPAKIAQNVGYNIFDVDFYTPDDAALAMRRHGLMIRKNKIQLEMLPGPPVPLPPRLEPPRAGHRKKKRKSDSPPPLGPVPSPPGTAGFGPIITGKDPRVKHHEKKVKIRKMVDIEDEDPVEKIHVPPFPSDPFKYRLQPYNEDQPSGQCAVQVIEGYFCQLCRKFYSSRTAGMVTHCKTRAHYEKLKAHLAKLKEST